MERHQVPQAQTLCGRRTGTAPPCLAGLAVTDPTERFSTRVDNYARYRPSYPAAALDLLTTQCGLAPGVQVADIGAGTGILSELLLARGARVYAVEPNDGMRAAAETQLGGRAGFMSIKGTAEATTLPAGSIDLLVAAQAFHWFDAPRARTEALRVVRPGAMGALLWNERPKGAHRFLDEYDALLRRYAPEYDRIVASRADVASMRGFFGGLMQEAALPNQQVFDFEGLKGRLLSSSYAPEAGQPQHEPLLAGLRELFARYEHGGRIVFPYHTLVYFGPLEPG
jgi:SAM-dependent methyltransferase